MSDMFRNKRKGLVASSLLFTACVPSALQAQAGSSLINSFLGFFTRTFVYMWKKNNIIEKTQKKLWKLRGIDDLGKIVKYLSDTKIGNFSDLIEGINNKIKELKTQNANDEKTDYTGATEMLVNNKIDNINAKIKECEKELCLDGIFSQYGKECVDKMLGCKEKSDKSDTALSYMCMDDFTDEQLRTLKASSLKEKNKLGALDDKGEFCLPLPFLSRKIERLEEEIKIKRTRLNNEENGLNTIIQASNREVVRKYIEEFRERVYDFAEGEALEKTKNFSSDEPYLKYGDLLQIFTNCLEEVFDDENEFNKEMISIFKGNCNSVFRLKKARNRYEKMRSDYEKLRARHKDLYEFDSWFCEKKEALDGAEENVKNKEVEITNSEERQISYIEEYFKENGISLSEKNLKKNLKIDDFFKTLAKNENMESLFEPNEDREKNLGEIKNLEDQLENFFKEKTKSENYLNEMKKLRNEVNEFKRDMEKSSGLGNFKHLGRLYGYYHINTWDDVFGNKDFLQKLNEDVKNFKYKGGEGYEKITGEMYELSKERKVLEMILKNNDYFNKNKNVNSDRKKASITLKKLINSKYYWGGDMNTINN